MTTRLVAAAVAAGFLLASGAPAPAQVTVDIAKITCNQWLAYKIADPDHIAIWLSGYYNGERKNSVIDVQAFKGNVAKLKDFCFKNPDTPIMQAVEKQVGASK